MNITRFDSIQVMHKKEVAEKKPVIHKASQVDDMYEMLAIYEQKVPTADQVKHDDLKEALTKYVEELRVGKEFLADHKAAQIDTLQTEINDINEELMSTFRTLNSGVLLHIALHRTIVFFMDINSLMQLQHASYGYISFPYSNKI